MVPEAATLDLPEGPLQISTSAAPSPDALFTELERSRAASVIFDWDSAAITHVNGAMERLMGLSAREILGRTGRQTVPSACDLLTDVISASLHRRGGYRGPTVLGGTLGGRVGAQIVIVEHGGRRYGVDVFRPEPPRPVSTATILVADDDPLLRRALLRGLAPIAPVVAVADAYEAIEVLARDPSIAVVVSDLDMPGTGRALHRALPHLRADLVDRFLCFTGAPEEAAEIDAPVLAKAEGLAPLREALRASLR